MKGREFDAQVARIKQIADRWIALLGLGDWDIRIKYERSQPEFDDDGWLPMMEISTKWMYLQARITAFVPAIAQISDEELERHLVHELGHILVNELATASRKDSIDHEERVVSQLTNAFINLRNKIREETKSS